MEVVLRMDEMEPLPVIPLCVKTIKDVVSDTIKRQGSLKSLKAMDQKPTPFVVRGKWPECYELFGIAEALNRKFQVTLVTPVTLIYHLDTICAICICLQLLQVAGHQDCVVVDVPRQRLRHPCSGEDGNGPQVGANMGSCSMVLMRGGFQVGAACRACHAICIDAFK